ncbi:MAG: isochorismatase family protein [Pirellula sp.]
MDIDPQTTRSDEFHRNHSHGETANAYLRAYHRREFVSFAGLVGAGLAADLLHSQCKIAGAEIQNEGASQLRIRPRYHRWHVDPGVEWIETNTAYAQLDWTIPLSQTALVLVDIWDHHYLKETEARAEKIIDERLVPLMTACRQAHMPIIHAPSPPQAVQHPNWVGKSQSSKVAEKRSDWPPSEFRNKSGSYSSYRRPNEARQPELTKLSANRIIHPKVQPVADEPVIATGDELHEHCKQHGILFLFYAGFNTNACILVRDYGTLDMSRRGYEVVLVRDCTTGMESRETQPTLSQTNGAILFLEMFGQYSVTSEEIHKGICS